MPPFDSPRDADRLIVYGLGTVGQAIVDDLLAEGINIELILDRGKGGESYRNIPVLAIEDAGDNRLTGKTILIGLHNHYVDINLLHASLLAAGAARILSPINLPELAPQARTRPGYWLDPGFSYAAHQCEFARIRNLLADEISRSLFDAILAYRQSGNIAECPVPSLEDEYTPIGL